MVYKQTSLNITPEQMRKAAQGKQITLSASQLSGGSMKTYLHPANYEKIMKSKKANRGARLYICDGAIRHDLERMEGASIWSWIKEKAFPWVKKNLWPALKPVLSPLVDQGAQMLGTYTGQPAIVNAVRGEVKSRLGVGLGKKKLTKGSAEAKAHMAAIRARRSGGSFRLS